MSSVTAEFALEVLRQLPPSEQLRVIAEVLPQATRSVLQTAQRPGDGQAETPAGNIRGTSRQRLDTLRGLWKDLGPAPSAEDIDEVRREMWAGFPRDDF